MSNSKSEACIEKLLEKRGIPKYEQDVFRHPDFERDTHSPWLLPGMEKAVSRLLDAHTNQEDIIIFGDYDADGVPATALLVRVLKRFGYTSVQGLIPTRTQGYGLTESVVQDIIARKPKIVIAVDNGTVAKQEVATLVAAGISVIIVDHHEPQEEKVAVDALAIINPKMLNSVYPFRELCACALSWKLACALAEKLGEDVAALKWELDLVGLSTIADMVPLVGENRVLAQFGLKVLGKTRNCGLQALKDVAGITGELRSGDVGFKLAPRINAPSRLHNETLDGEHSSLTLLTTNDNQNAQSIAEHLDIQNADRQKLVDVHIAQAEERLGDSDSLVIVVFHDEWSSGSIAQTLNLHTTGYCSCTRRR
jgi:single-stranded-DNA-specific exonuclease